MEKNNLITYSLQNLIQSRRAAFVAVRSFHFAEAVSNSLIGLRRPMTWAELRWSFKRAGRRAAKYRA